MRSGGGFRHRLDRPRCPTAGFSPGTSLERLYAHRDLSRAPPTCPYRTSGGRRCGAARAPSTIRLGRDEARNSAGARVTRVTASCAQHGEYDPRTARETAAQSAPCALPVSRRRRRADYALQRSVAGRLQVALQARQRPLLPSIDRDGSPQPQASSHAAPSRRRHRRRQTGFCTLFSWARVARRLLHGQRGALRVARDLRADCAQRLLEEVGDCV